MLIFIASLLWFAGSLTAVILLGLLFLPYWVGLVILILLFALAGWVQTGLLRFLPGVIHLRLPPFDWAGFAFYGVFTVVVAGSGWLGTHLLINMEILSDVWFSFIPWVGIPLIIQLILFILSLIPTRK